MHIGQLRRLMPLLVLVVAGIGFALSRDWGTLCGVGWADVSLLCPLGALETMIAERTLIPRACISLIAAIALIVLVGRAFCAWICPVPLLSRLRYVFVSRDERERRKAEQERKRRDALLDSAVSRGVGSWPSWRDAFDSRHVVLAVSLLLTAVFGFPVFCVVCPIGLAFSCVLVIFLLFSQGDVSWTVVAIPFVLAVEVVFFRKWCSSICPLSAFMSLVGKANRTFLPRVASSCCIERDGVTCGRCHHVCNERIDPRHPERGASFSECTRCASCIEACPGKAISFLRQSDSAGDSK